MNLCGSKHRCWAWLRWVAVLAMVASFASNRAAAQPDYSIGPAGVRIARLPPIRSGAAARMAAHPHDAPRYTGPPLEELPPPLEETASPIAPFDDPGDYGQNEQAPVDEPRRLPAISATEGFEIPEIEFCESCGCQCGGGCYCPDCQNMGPVARFVHGVYRGICCPDPCYEPRWRPLADAAFFTNSVRPVNQQRFRWDFAEDFQRMDRAEYFWARADGNGLGPSPAAMTQFRGIDYDELSHYVEAAHGPLGVSFEYTYRALDVDGTHYAGFGDMTIATKTLLYDTELLQIAMQFRTFIPQGASREGLGTGHASLIFGLNVSPVSYLQVEVGEWIPLGGDATYAGALLHYSMAYNHVLWQPHPCVPIIGTTEISGWSFQDGLYTDPVLGANQPASGETYLHGSSGIRTFICDKVDFGVSASFPITDMGWQEKWLRSEMRFRF
jgi:hypothetical protein